MVIQQHNNSQPWGDDVYSKLSWFRRERVSSAKVMVVGCGALGNEVLKNLVLFGVEHIVVVDFDRVEASNLTRSILFTQKDAEQGRTKVETVAERLREINPAVEIRPIFGDIAYDVGLGLLRRMDVVIGCVDSRWGRFCINRLCMRAGVPWVDGGIDGLDGTVRVFEPGRNCYACNLGTEGLREMTQRMSCAGIVRRNETAGRAATTPVIASIIGAVQVQEAMKLIHKEELEQGHLTSLCGKVFHYEGEHMTTQTASFEAYDEDCPEHERWEPIQQSAVSSQQSVGEALGILENELGGDNVTILLRNDCFVDYVEYSTTGEQQRVMCQGRMVADKLGGKNETGKIYQHEYNSVDKTFPYMDLTLRQLGLPDNDVIQVRTEKGDKYLELKRMC